MSSSGDYGGFEPIYDMSYISEKFKYNPDKYLKMFNFSDIERYVRKKKLINIEGNK
jgi:hypothetical protein